MAPERFLFIMSRIRRIVAAAITLTVASAATLLFSTTPAHAAQTSSAHVRAVQPLVITTVTAADLAPTLMALTATARPGEGVIRIVTRVCGNASNWQLVAAANNIRPPVYLVLLGQQLAVSCTAGSVAPSVAVPSTPASGWVAPLRACIVSSFGWRWGRMHYGTDLSAGYGTAIRAVRGGTVSVGWQSGGAGNYTMVNHGSGLWSVYMHQSSFAVRSGWVNAGQIIGYVGSTGNSTGPHLHLEIHTGGLWSGRVDPVPFLRNRGVALGC